MLEFKPILQTLEDNAHFQTDAETTEVLEQSVAFYKSVGFHPPWICYFVFREGVLVGQGAFKGRPVSNKVEIAYGTGSKYRNQGIGTAICAQLVALARQTDPALIITAQTLPEENASTKILSRNHFKHVANAWDPDEGQVWEWLYEG